MRLSGLLDLVTRDDNVAEVLRRAGAASAPAALRTTVLEVSAPDALAPVLLAALARARPVLAVAATDREAEDLAAALRDLRPVDSVTEFPGWETLPHERLSPSSDT
ncbi:MAG: hypothetical protein ABI468_10605, partial [Candidatus Nanopelagicales bacterium]